MSFLKLCQISNKQYIETVDREVVLNSIQSFPQTLSCEIINWESEDELRKRGKALSFESIEVEILEEPLKIRDAIHNLLLEQFPDLVK